MTLLSPESRERPVISRRALLLGTSAVAVAAALPFAPVADAAPVVIRGPLTLQQLKALSEQALPILQKHFPESLCDGPYLAEDGDNYHGLRIRCDCTDRWDDYCFRCASPLDGTPMVGGLSGYYEPEWTETTTYGALSDVLWWTERPASMTEAEWLQALAIVGMTLAEHADRMARIEAEISELQACEPALTVGSAPLPTGQGEVA